MFDKRLKSLEARLDQDGIILSAAEVIAMERKKEKVKHLAKLKFGQMQFINFELERELVGFGEGLSVLSPNNLVRRIKKGTVHARSVC